MIIVIGAGLAGCEAAWAAAERGRDVLLIEQKPLHYSPAHKSDGFAELVCSNSFKAKRPNSAAGLLKEEMRALGSLTVECAYLTEVPAGGALAVDRERFSALVTERIRSHPRIEVKYAEVTEIPDNDDPVIIATGPLTEGALAEDISRITGGYLHFHDAASPYNL